MLNKKSLSDQYSTDEKLDIRVNFHDKYSTNKQGFFNWVGSLFEFKDDVKILELGCGNGKLWDNCKDLLPDNCEIILSDNSQGMIAVVNEKFKDDKRFKYQVIDIEHIEFEDNLFDVVIANHMLYHISDIDTAIKEVYRVLKDDGVFYATTNGNYGLHYYLNQAVKSVDENSHAFEENFKFSMQNGKDILNRFFTNVLCVNYEDSLVVSNVEDLLLWMKSTASIAKYDVELEPKMRKYFNKQREIIIKKEVGCFISRK